MNKFIKMPFLLALCVLLFANRLEADVLIIDRINQSKSIDMPARGLNMKQVIQKFGEPNVKKSPVGEPPITVWQYAEFSVYFENNWVINSVALKSSANEKGPKPNTN